MDSLDRLEMTSTQHHWRCTRGPGEDILGRFLEVSQQIRSGDATRNSPSLKLTAICHLKMDGWNSSFLLGWPIFRGYVSFRECIIEMGDRSNH